jgi:hypothetical protein
MRNCGFGSRLVKVAAIDGQRVTLHTYGYLAYGDITYPKKLVYNEGRLHENSMGTWVITERGFNGGTYEPVQITSRFYDAGDAFDRGVSGTKHKIKNHWGIGHLREFAQERRCGNPFKGTELENTYWDGVNSVLATYQE